MYIDWEIKYAIAFCLILDYLLLRDSQQRGIIYAAKGNLFLKAVNDMYQFIYFQLKKIVVVIIGLAFSYISTIIIRGPFEHYRSISGDLMGGVTVSVYWYNTFGQTFLFISPFLMLGVIVWLGVKKLDLHPMIYVSLLLTSIPFYMAFILIMAFAW